jgi:hypothetical protein
MSSIDFGVDHRFFPAGRRPDELGVGFLVVNPLSPSDFIRLSNVPQSVRTTTLNPRERLGSSTKNNISIHLEHFLKVHYNVGVQRTGEISGVQLVTERINNVSSSILNTMLSAPNVIDFLRRVAQERAQRSKIKSWAAVFFNMDPWLVMSTHTFYDSSVNIDCEKATSAQTHVKVSAGGSIPGAEGDATSSRDAETAKEGRRLEPLVFAAKFQQIRYKLKGDRLISCYLCKDRPVPLGFFNDTAVDDKDPIKSSDDLIEAIRSGEVEIQFETGKETGFGEFVDPDDTVILDGETYVKSPEGNSWF